MVEHICTTEDMVIGEIEFPKSECLICCKQSIQKAGYIGIYCPECKNIISGEEWRGDIARLRRKILGLTKKQIGDKIGKSKHTIHSYEWTKCPESYLEQLKDLILQD